MFHDFTQYIQGWHYAFIVIFGDETTGTISIENNPIHVFCDKNLLRHGTYPAIFQDYSWHTSKFNIKTF